MKIAHVIDSWYGLYGAEVMLLNLIQEQSRIGIQPILFSLGSQSEGEKPIESEARKRGIQVRQLRLSKGLNIRAALSIVKTSRVEGIDLIHSHGYKSDILLGVLPRHYRQIPVISTIHGWIAVQRFSKIWFYMYLNKIFLRRLDAIVKVNGLPWTGPDTLLFKGTRSFVVENGLAPRSKDWACRGDTGNQQVEAFCKEGFIIGAIGRLSPEKGFPYLIDALEELINVDKSFKLIIIGEGRSRGELKEMINAKGLSQYVMISGYLENASRYLSLFNVLVLPSLTEGLPITLLEAMQAGIPIIATSVGGMPNVLENGKYGILVKPQDSRQLFEAILSVQINPSQAAARAERAKETVSVRYSSKRMAEEYIKVYNLVLETRRPVIQP